MLVNWAPNATTDQVSSYTVSPAVASGFTGEIKTGCGNPASVASASTDSSALVGGLCAKVPYVFTMTATNALGTSVASNTSDVATPLAAQPPNAPLIVSVLNRNDSLIVSWSAPTLAGGNTLIGYVLSVTGGTRPITLKLKARALQATVRGLLDSTTYTVSLAATSKAGSSIPSMSSGTPQATYAPGAQPASRLSRTAPEA